jgi:uncharacterized membrane protein YbhN (UPF0104 family)
MSNVTGGIARAIRRNFHWSWIAGAISVVIVAAAVLTLFRLSREIRPGDVVAALKSQSPSALAAAAGFVVAGYVMLTCYDVFALRAIGWSRVPYRVAAFASFTSYTIGHNCGVTVFTSGLIRYRIYAAWGLGVVEIAKIAFITGLTYCLGNAFVLGGGLAYAPGAVGAVDHLPASINRWIGIAVVAALLAYLLWLASGPRLVGRSGWQLALPGLQSSLFQIAIGSLDLIFVALAMYVLLPGEPAVGVLDVIVVFVTAMMIGVVSYVPGSLGVIEAAMLIGLPQYHREELLASLLTFRVLYFVLPLVLAACLMGLREFRAAITGYYGRV